MYLAYELELRDENKQIRVRFRGGLLRSMNGSRPNSNAFRLGIVVPQLRSKRPIHILPVTNLGYDNVMLFMVRVVDDAVIARTNPSQLWITMKLPAVGRRRVFLEGFYTVKYLRLQILG